MTAQALVGLAAGAAIAFALTNVDDIFLLAMFFADPRLRVSRVVGGQYLGIGALVALSLLGRSAALLFSPGAVRWLGLLPVALGIKKLFDLRKGGAEADGTPSSRTVSRPEGSFVAQTFSVAAVTMANGGDNLGVYVPMFASLSAAQLVATLAVFAVMTALWCALGYALVRNPLFGRPMQRLAGRITPFVLVALGLAILFRDRLPAF